MEQSPLGTGGALKKALESCENSEVFIFNGDTFLELDYESVITLWGESMSPVIVGKCVEDTGRYGSMIVEESRIIRFNNSEKNLPGLINSGTYYFSRDWLEDRLPQQMKFSFEADFLSRSVLDYSYTVHVADGVFVDIGIPEDFMKAQKLLKCYGY